MDRRTLFLATAAATALGLIGVVALPTIASGSTAAPHRVEVRDELVRYDPNLVPAGAWARVQEIRPDGGKTVVLLQVRGLQPNRSYGAHAHVNACGATGSAAGPHFQNVPDPVQPSTNPAYANPDNEIWLDSTTNAAGNGTAVRPGRLSVTFGMRFRPIYRPNVTLDRAD